MGGTPYWYIVDYQENPRTALEELRRREFEAGRYNPVIDDPMGDPTACPGSAHASIEEAIKASGADGTRSILDVLSVGLGDRHGHARFFGPDELIDLFGSYRPAVEQFDVAGEAMDRLFERIERGKACCVVGYDAQGPSKLLFAGYSFD